MGNERKLRLIQVAKEFNVGLNTITDFLQKKGIKSDGAPNMKVDAETYAVLEREFGRNHSTGGIRDSVRERVSPTPTPPAVKQESESEVFISYSRKDTAIADRICAAFDRAGDAYFIDRQGIGGGQEFPDVLAQAIVDCKVVLFLAGRNSYASKFTNGEIAFAFNKKKNILPFCIDDCEMPLGLQLMCSGINWRDMREHSIDAVLVNDILRMLGRAPGPTPRPAAAPPRPKTYRVGDYYNENGKEGVVFEVDNTGRHGKIVGLRQVKLPWCIDAELERSTGATDMKNGRYNQQVIQQISGWREKYPAFAWCAEHGREWYLPALEELKLLLLNDDVYAAVNQRLGEYGVTMLLNRGNIECEAETDEDYDDFYEYQSQSDEIYWSSSASDINDDCSWFVMMNCRDYYLNYKTDRHYIRAVSVF